MMTAFPEELSPEDCLERLGTQTVGRVVFCASSGPQIYPVNFVMDGGTIVFRTAPDGLLATHVHDGEVAFEVDELDPELHQGWSVVAVGAAQMLEAGDLQEFISERTLEPWAGGTHSLHVRVTPRHLTGRQVRREGQP